MDLSSIPIDDLLDCCRYGELEDIREYARQILMENSMDVEGPVEFLRLQGHHGNSCLHMAAANGHQDLLVYILSRLPAPTTQYINLRNHEGNTALHWAAINGHVEAVRSLMKSGADAKIQNNSGHTALYDAQTSGKDAVVNAILEMADFGTEEQDDDQSVSDTAADDTDSDEDAEIVFQRNGQDIKVDIRPKKQTETPQTGQEEEAGAR